MLGNLLILTKSVSAARIQEAAKVSESLGRKFEPGFILDSFSEERERAMTIDSTRAQMMYNGAAFELIDVPGHEELINNMLTGVSYGDLGILLVSARKDEGITPQARRHLLIAKMLGVERVIVAVNKMDTVSYSEARFLEIKRELEEYLDKISVNAEQFVPISAYDGDNLISPSSKMGWYSGETLADAMLSSALKAVEPSVKPAMILQGNLDNGFVMGKVISGKIKKGEKVTLLPGNDARKIRQLIAKGRKADSATSGENISIMFDKGTTNVKGRICVDADDLISISNKAKALIFLTAKLGSKASIKRSGVETGCRISIKKSIDDKGIVHDSKTASVLSAAHADISFDEEIPIELNIPELKRFTIYSNGRFVGIGNIVG